MAEKKKIPAAVAWREARQLMYAHRRYLAIGFCLMIVSRLAGFVLPAGTKFFVDDVVGKGRTSLLLPLAAAVGIATLVQAVTAFANSQIIGVTAQRAITDMRREVNSHVIRLPVSFFDSTQSGILISRIMTDAEGIRNLVGTGIIQLVGGMITALIALGFLFWLNWQLTLAILIVLVVFGSVMGLAFTRLRPVFRERGEINAQVTGRLGETLGGIRIVKAYGTERREDRIFTRGVHRLFRNIASSITGTSAVATFATLVIGIISILVFVIGGRAILSGGMTLGSLFMYIYVTALMAAPVIQIASIGTQISEAFAGLDRIRELRQMATESDEDAGRQPLQSVEGEVAFENVTFEYNPGIPVLKGVSFQAPAGSTTALVGSSGSGKSTLIGLVMAFNRPKEGRILIDGTDLDDLRLHDYRTQLGVVLQENFLFDGTVADNIRFARPDATREDVEAAAKIAHVDEFTRGFPEGYDTIVGERGIKLSGGQRQRIAIARAILADPRILILDEATSSLDSESEALIQDGLRRLRQGRTTFVIAHRLSTIRSADQILVLEQGEIVERGTHRELMALGGRYRELHDRQYAWEADRFINPGEDFTPELEIPKPARPGVSAR
ncbi:MAG: ABC transporter ATP-binding protein/permease [Gemmatimonadetes bacterium]|nr:ABC transporter ATP-binding protein/permease [Gemmatimonadota bacterium]